MLFAVLDQFSFDAVGAVVTLVTVAGSLVAAVTFHEFSHATVASRLGDSTARLLGRVSLNPRNHLDPLGSVMMLVAGIGWGKPVPVNTAYLRPNPRSGMAIVAGAGPLSNLLLAAVLAVPINIGLVNPELVDFTFFRGGAGDLPAYVLSSLVYWNILLAAINVIPIAPLDGFKIVLGLLPRGAAPSFARLESYGPMILIAVVMADVVLGTGVLRAVITAVRDVLVRSA